MTGQIFGGAVAHDARAEFERTDQQRCGEGVIDDQRHVRRRGTTRRSCRARPRAAEDWRWFRRSPRPVLTSAKAASNAARSQTSTCDVSTPIGLEDIHQHRRGGAVHHVGGQHAFRAVDQRGQHGQCRSRSSRRRRRSRRAPPSSSRTTSSSAAARGVVVTRIGRPGFFQRKYAVQLRPSTRRNSSRLCRSAS